MPSKKGREGDAGIFLDDELLSSSTVHRNVGQQFIVITADRAKLCLMEHKQALDSRYAWLAPLGLLATALTTLATATFHDTLGIAGPTWQAVFVLAAIASGLWLAVSLAVLFYRRRERTLEYLLKRLKAESTADE